MSVGQMFFLPKDVRPRQKTLTGSNSLAYIAARSVMTEQRFKTLELVSNVMKLFTVVIYKCLY
jgi:hypothetical protein